MTMFLDGTQAPSQTISASGAQATQIVNGTVFLTSATATNLTILAPKAGGPVQAGQPVPSPSQISVGSGQDNSEIQIFATGAVAHTVTAGANKINLAGANKTTATLGAVAGGILKLKAFNGQWWVVSAPAGTTYA